MPRGRPKKLKAPEPAADVPVDPRVKAVKVAVYAPGTMQALPNGTIVKNA